jgi:hypothetical protein
MYPAAAEEKPVPFYCSRCRENYDPKRLPHSFACGHNVCRVCLDKEIAFKKSSDARLCESCRRYRRIGCNDCYDFIRVSSSIVCRVCQCRAPVELLPVNCALRDTIAAECLGTPYCGDCVQSPARSTHHCTDCSLWLCAAHVTAHRASRQLAAHGLVPATKDNVVAKPKSRCKMHPDKVLDVLCRSHAMVTCERCALLLHRQCQLEEIRGPAFDGHWHP